MKNAIGIHSMKITVVLILTCLAAIVLGIDPYTYGFIAARPSLILAVVAMFLHDPSSLWHLAGNMVGLVVFGTLVEREIGSTRFAALYLASGLVGAGFHLLVSPFATVPMVGCSGAVFGIMAAAAMLRPRLAGFVVAYAAINIWMMLTQTGGSVAVGCHVGGFVTGFGAMALRMIAARERQAA